MFVDRSLRSMAAFMVALAVTMIASCISLATRLGEVGPITTSIPIATGTKGDMDGRCEVHFASLLPV